MSSAEALVELDKLLCDAAVAGQEELDKMAMEQLERRKANNLILFKLFNDALPEWAWPYLVFSQDFANDRKGYLIFPDFTLYMAIDTQLTFSWGYWNKQRNDWSYLYSRSTFEMACAKAVKEGGPRTYAELFPLPPF